MKILIFTCLCQCATHCCNVALHPLQMLPVLSAAHNEGKDVFLQLKARHNITLGRGREMRKRRRHLDTAAPRGQTHCFIGQVAGCLNCHDWAPNISATECQSSQHDKSTYI